MADVTFTLAYEGVDYPISNFEVIAQEPLLATITFTSAAAIPFPALGKNESGPPITVTQFTDGVADATATFDTPSLLAGGGASSDYAVETGPYSLQPGFPCFARGTRIATPAGARPVEDIVAGDLVLNADGVARPVVWTGSRRVRIRSHPNANLVRPVRITANAFAEGVPVRDLMLSPDHNVMFEGSLIPAKCLVNRMTVVCDDPDEVVYYHIELETHDVVLAEGLEVETYLDTGNRKTFENWALTLLHPDFATGPDMNYFQWEARGCAPLVLCGPVVDRARAALLARVPELVGGFGSGAADARRSRTTSRRHG